MGQGSRFPEAASDKVGSATNREQQNGDSDGDCGYPASIQSGRKGNMRLQVQVIYERKCEDEV